MQEVQRHTMANTDIAIFLLRLVAGVVFLVHGYPKARNYRGTFNWLVKEKWPLPIFSTALLAIGETLGAVLLILGIFTVPVAIFLGILMAGAAFHHFRKGEGWKGAETAIMLLIICAAIAIAGGGAWQLAG